MGSRKRPRASQSVRRLSADYDETPTDWDWVTNMLGIRSGGACEVCRTPFGHGVHAMNRHHRQPRGMGGNRDPRVDSLVNILAVCGGSYGGVMGCHGDIEANRSWALDLGYLVPRGSTEFCDPAQVPVVLRSGRRVLLSHDGPQYLHPTDGVEWFLGSTDTPGMARGA